MLWWFAQTTLVAAGLAALATLAGRLKRLGPESRHALWLVVLAKFVIPPVVAWPWSLPDSWPRPAGSAAEAVVPAEPVPAPAPGDFAEGDRAGPAVAPPERARVATGSSPAEARARSGLEARRSVLPALLLGLWAAGSVAVVVRQSARIARFRRGLAGAVPAPGWLVAEMGSIGERLGVRPPPVLVLPGGGTPLLWCLGRPRLIVPSSLIGRLAADRWAGLLAHELAHLARRDHWVVRVELVAEAVWWWNPLFWHARGRLRDEAERACDARAVAALPPGRRFAYAEALIEVCEHLARSAAIPPPALGVGGAGASRSLEGRLKMILREPVPRRSGRLAALAAATLAALSLPVWTLGQQPDPPKVDPPKAAEAAPAGPDAVLDPDDLLAGDSPEAAALSGLDPLALRKLAADPDVVAAAQAFRRARADLDAVIRRSQAPTDPDEQAARKRLAEASRHYAQVYSTKTKQARNRPEPRADDEGAGLLLNLKKATERLEQLQRITREKVDPATRKARSDVDQIRSHLDAIREARGRPGPEANAGGPAPEDLGRIVAELQAARRAFEDASRAAGPDDPAAQKEAARMGALQGRFDGAVREFRGDPEVVALLSDLDQRKAKLENVQRIVRTPDDPAIRKARDAVEAAQARYVQARKAQEGPIRDRIADEVALLQARRDGKAAAVRKAEAQRMLAKSIAARNEHLRKKGPNYVSDEEMARGEGELGVAEAEVGIRKSELDEADLILAQARRRLDAVAGPTPDEARRNKAGAAN